MTTYTGITIGPIVSTIQMARRPRELWSASYLFSHLMKCIMKSIPQKEDIISPFYNEIMIDEKLGVGLYPDRLFVKGSISYNTIQTAIQEVAGSVGLSKDYFHVMVITEDCGGDSEAIHKLNRKLDYLELCSIATHSATEDSVLQLIKKKWSSPLFQEAFENEKYNVKMLSEYASAQLAANNGTQKDWEEAKNKAKVEEMTLELIPEEFREYFKDESDPPRFARPAGCRQNPARAAWARHPPAAQRRTKSRRCWPSCRASPVV